MSLLLLRRVNSSPSKHRRMSIIIIEIYCYDFFMLQNWTWSFLYIPYRHKRWWSRGVSKVEENFPWCVLAFCTIENFHWWMVDVIGRRKLRAWQGDWVAFSTRNKLITQIILFETWKNGFLPYVRVTAKSSTHISSYTHDAGMEK